MEYYTYGSDTALRDRTAVELPPADLIEFDNLNHLVLAGLTVKSTRRASGARVVESAGENFCAGLTRHVTQEARRIVPMLRAVLP